MPEGDDLDCDPLIEFIINCEDWHNLDFSPEEIGIDIINKILGEFENSNGSIDVLLTDDEEIRSLNKQWRNIDKPTNVLSFEHNQTNGILGDIAISLNYCINEAQIQGKNLKNHYIHLLVHGVLHLLGYDHIDEEEAQEMENIEKEILANMGIEDPYLIGQ